jgi:hypothetical protein
MKACALVMLSCISINAHAETSIDLTLLGLSNHFTSEYEISPGQFVQPVLNEINMGFGIGISHRGRLGEVWVEFDAYDNSFNNNSKAMLFGAGFRAGEYFLGLGFGGATGYEKKIQELGGLTVRTGASNLMAHKNLWILSYRVARFDISDFFE